MNYDPITLFSIGICIGAPLTVLMVTISDKIEDTKRKKRFRENQKKIKDGTFVGAPYYSGIPTTSIAPLALNKLKQEA